MEMENFYNSQLTQFSVSETFWINNDSNNSLKLFIVDIIKGETRLSRKTFRKVFQKKKLKTLKTMNFLVFAKPKLILFRFLWV